jgi:hypothetical protein
MNVAAAIVIIGIIVVITVVIVYFRQETYISFRKCLDEESMRPAQSWNDRKTI